MQIWVMCQVTEVGTVVLSSYLGPYDSAVVRNGTPGLRYESTGALPCLSSSVAVSVGTEPPNDQMCLSVINTKALPSVKSSYQGQLAWRVAKPEYR